MEKYGGKLPFVFFSSHGLSRVGSQWSPWCGWHCKLKIMGCVLWCEELGEGAPVVKVSQVAQ